MESRTFLLDLVQASPEGISRSVLAIARRELIQQGKLLEETILLDGKRGNVRLRLVGGDVAPVQEQLDRAFAQSDGRGQKRFERQEARLSRMGDQAFKRKLAERRRKRLAG